MSQPWLVVLALALFPAVVLAQATAPVIQRDAQDRVTLTAPPGLELRYWRGDGSGDSSISKRYDRPFGFPGGIVRAVAIPLDGRPLSDGAVSQAEFAARAPATQPATQPAAKPAPFQPVGWADLKPDPAAFAAVKRTSDALPLSDQDNQGHWRKYAPMWDEFDGDALDSAKWWPNNPSWKGRQPGLFLERNIQVHDGQMHLIMRKETTPEMATLKGYSYTCAAVQSKTAVRYGYFEVRAQAMKSGGSSAFWFYHGTKPWWTEIDVFEIRGAAAKLDALEIGRTALQFERKMHITMHVFHTPNLDRHFQIGSAYVAPANLADDYHVYGLEWDEARLRFYFDGVLVRQGPNTHWHQPLTLNFDSETMPDWFGLPRDEDLPSTYSVDHVRAWKAEDGTMERK